MISYSREQTSRMFKTGEIAFRETALGGCTNPGSCESRAFDFLDLGCLNKCKHMVVKLSNVNRVLPSLTVNLARLDPNSVEYRTKRTQMDQLLSVQSKLQQLKEFPNE